MRSIEVLNVINGKTLETNEIVKFEGFYKVTQYHKQVFFDEKCEISPGGES